MSVFCTRVVVDEGWKGEDIRKPTVIIGEIRISSGSMSSTIAARQIELGRPFLGNTPSQYGRAALK